jgi:hypothetical protein
LIRYVYAAPGKKNAGCPTVMKLQKKGIFRLVCKNVYTFTSLCRGGLGKLDKSGGFNAFSASIDDRQKICLSSVCPSLTFHPVGGSIIGLWPLFLLKDKD